MKYTVTSAPARIHTGVLVLNKEQARRRRHNLKSLGKDRYEIVNPVEFKAGEVIGYEGDLPKAMADVMVDESEAKKIASKKAKAQSEEKARKEAEEKAAAEKKQAEIDALYAEIASLEADLVKAETAEAKAEIEANLAAKNAALDALFE
jgi:hypothetical protein